MDGYAYFYIIVSCESAEDGEARARGCAPSQMEKIRLFSIKGAQPPARLMRFLGAQPQRHPNSKTASSPLWMAMRQQWLILNSIISHESVR